MKRFYKCLHEPCGKVVVNEDGNLHWAQAGMILPTAQPGNIHPIRNAHIPVFCSVECEEQAREIRDREHAAALLLSSNQEAP